jgi:putative acetyltransferase
MIIKPYSTRYADEVVDLFHSSVLAIDPRIYSEKEKEAWAPSLPNYKYWKERLAKAC